MQNQSDNKIVFTIVLQGFSTGYKQVGSMWDSLYGSTYTYKILNDYSNSGLCVAIVITCASACTMYSITLHV